MKQQISLFLLIPIFLVSCGGSQNTTAPAEAEQEISTNTDSLLFYQQAITSNFLRDHLTPFAADSMEGRETAMEGQKKAARYLSTQYKKLGLKPVGDNDTYLQKFDLKAEQTDSVVFMTYQSEDSTQNEISHTINSKTSTANYVQRYGGKDMSDADIVFAGFGVQNENLAIDNLQGADVQGKWVMVFAAAPQVVNGDSLYTSERQFTRAWLGNLIQKGITGILVIPNSIEEFEEAVQNNQRGFGQPSGMKLAYRAEEGDGPGWSYDYISPKHAAEILELKGLDELDSMREDIAKNITDFKAHRTGYGLTQIPYVKDVTLDTENVVAYMEGANPELKDEVVVLSAHYDHVGIGAPDSTGDTIYNGANDDGSGTIGVLSAAHAFAEARENGIKPRRSILFLSVSGEEKGLLGSRYYSDHPIFPIEKTVADINTDMIGRVDPEHEEEGNSNYIYIIGGEIISSQLDSLLKAGNDHAGQLELDMRYNDLEDPNQFYRRSDHWNFGRFGIPFVFFFNGVHEDYHQPSDEVEKINYDLMRKTARSMFATTVMVANADSAPKVDNQEFIEITKEE